MVEPQVYSLLLQASRFFAEHSESHSGNLFNDLGASWRFWWSSTLNLEQRTQLVEVSRRFSLHDQRAFVTLLGEMLGTPSGAEWFLMQVGDEDLFRSWTVLDALRPHSFKGVLGIILDGPEGTGSVDDVRPVRVWLLPRCADAALFELYGIEPVDAGQLSSVRAAVMSLLDKTWLKAFLGSNGLRPWAAHGFAVRMPLVSMAIFGCLAAVALYAGILKAVSFGETALQCALTTLAGGFLAYALVLIFAALGDARKERNSSDP